MTILHRLLRREPVTFISESSEKERVDEIERGVSLLELQIAIFKMEKEEHDRSNGEQSTAS